MAATSSGPCEPGKPRHGSLPDLDDCSYIYYCSREGNLFHLKCPDGQHFNKGQFDEEFISILNMLKHQYIIFSS